MRKLIVPELAAPGRAAARGGAGASWLRRRLKHALVDPQQRRIDTLRVSVTDRCNYRCTYCMPDGGVAHGAREETLSFEEIAAVVRLFVRLGVRRVRVTGGEPTVRRELPALVRLLRAIAGLEEIALSTNGHLLEALAAPLRGRGGRSAERQPRFAAPRTVPADHGRRRSGARPGGPRRRRRAPAFLPSRSTPSRSTASTTTSSPRSAGSPGRAGGCRASSRRCRWRPAARTCPGVASRPRRSARASRRGTRRLRRPRRRRRRSRRRAGPLLPAA